MYQLEMKMLTFCRRFFVTTCLCLLAACTQDPFTRGAKLSQTVGSGGMGAAAGAGIGAATALIQGTNSRDIRRKALLGAGMGVLYGVYRGYNLDRQEAELRVELEKSGVSVTRRGDNIVLNMGSALTFGDGSAAMTANAISVTRAVAKVFLRFDKTLIDVLGFADDTGPATFNNNISLRRASNVAGVLIREGVEKNRIAVEGRGHVEPLVPSDSDEGRLRNRRVEVYISPV